MLKIQVFLPKHNAVGFLDLVRIMIQVVYVSSWDSLYIKCYCYCVVVIVFVMCVGVVCD